MFWRPLCKDREGAVQDKFADGDVCVCVCVWVGGSVVVVVGGGGGGVGVGWGVCIRQKYQYDVFPQYFCITGIYNGLQIIMMMSHGWREVKMLTLLLILYASNIFHHLNDA